MHQLGETSIYGVIGGLVCGLIPQYWECSTLFDILFTSVLPWIALQIMTGIYWHSIRLKRPDWEIQFHVLIRASLLGLGISVGQVLVCRNVDVNFGWYLTTLSFFHYSEYLVTAMINPSLLTLDSFLLNHSKAYGVAALASWIEYLVELSWFPWMKWCGWPMKTGLFFCIAGESLRKGAMLTAWNNFTHTIRERKTQDHQLVTHGLYSIYRHPSYAGWFWWSVGTQMILHNPLCTLAYALVSWKYFSERIRYEEATLVSFFGDKYLKYQEDVPRTGVPLVQGYNYGAEIEKFNESRRTAHHVHKFEAEASSEGSDGEQGQGDREDRKED